MESPSSKRFSKEKIEFIQETFRSYQNMKKTSRICQVSKNSVKKYKNYQISSEETTISLVEALVKLFTLKNPIQTNKMLQNYLLQKTSKIWSLSQLCKIKKRIGIRRRRVNNVASQRDTERIQRLRITFKEHMISNFIPQEIMWIDEVHVKSRDMNPTYGYFVEKQTNVIVTPFVTNASFSFIVAMTYNQVIVVHCKNTLSEGHTALDFIDFLKMCPFNDYIGFKDGASIHTSSLVDNFEINNGIKMIKNIPYSCDFNAIELLFNYLKSKIKNSHIMYAQEIPNKFKEICSVIPKKTIQSFVEKIWKNFKN